MAMDSRELALFVWRDRIGRLTREELLHLAEKGEWPERLRIG